MKRIILKLVVVLIAVLCTCSLRISGVKAAGDDEYVLTYEYDDSNMTATVTGINNKAVTKVIIPETVEHEGKEYTVNKIGDCAFYACINLTDIELPYSIKIIGFRAFDFCLSLTHVELPAGLMSIGESSFRDCSSLTTVGILDDVKDTDTENTVGGSSLSDADIPSGLISVGPYAFSRCSNLESIELPEGIKRIDFMAFFNCYSLTSIELPSGLTSIGGGAFTLCSSLKAIELPSGLTSIGASAFYVCTSLIMIELPAGITEIGVDAFYCCTSLMSIKIPVGVTSIGQKAFMRCTSLNNIVIPDTVIDISDTAFLEIEESITIYAGEASYAENYAKEKGLAHAVISADDLAPAVILFLEKDRYKVGADMYTYTNIDSNIQYRWKAYKTSAQETFIIQDWTTGNGQLSWEPDSYGEYKLIGEAKYEDDSDVRVFVETEAFEFNPHIKGKCQMPWYSDGGGFLIGVESYENPNQSYQYEMLILDCTLLAEGKPAWVYTTNKFTVTEGAAGWCIWKPQYGYYWTLFRVYDAAGNMIDQACYPFVNAY